MNLTVEPALTQWLSAKNKDTITVDAIVSRGGGCCGGCSFVEVVIDYKEPQGDKNKYLLLNRDNINIYLAKVLEKKTNHITLFLKGTLFKRAALKGYEADCSWKQKKNGI